MEECRYSFFQKLIDLYPGGIRFLESTEDGRIVLKPRKGRISFIYVKTSGILRDGKGEDGFSFSCLVPAGSKSREELFSLMLSACRVAHTEHGWVFREHEAVGDLVAEALVTGLRLRVLYPVLNADIKLMETMIENGDI